MQDQVVATWVGETAGDYAGVTLGAGGDISGDGVDDMLVGASGYDGEGGGGGKLYMVSGRVSPGSDALSNAWASVTGLGVPAPPHGAFGTGDFVGDAFVGGFDFDGDGWEDLAVGASGDQTIAPNAGKAAIFFGPLGEGDHLVTDADVTLFGPAEGAYGGSPMAGVPDSDQDGRAELLVSADALGAGWVYLIQPAMGQTSLNDASVQFEGAISGDLFGYALAVGDLSGDGEVELVITATSASVTALGAGGTWVFSGPFEPGVVAAASGKVLYGEAASDSSGSAAAILQASSPALAIGARNSDAGGAFSGRVYLYDGRDLFTDW